MSSKGLPLCSFHVIEPGRGACLSMTVEVHTDDVLAKVLALSFMVQSLASLWCASWLGVMDPGFSVVTERISSLHPTAYLESNGETRGLEGILYFGFWWRDILVGVVILIFLYVLFLVSQLWNPFPW